MYVITVQFEIKSEHLEAFREAMRTQARNSLELEPACRQFDVCFTPEDPQKCFLYEKYDDEAAFATHRGTDHFKRFSQTVEPMVANKTLQAWTQDPA